MIFIPFKSFYRIYALNLFRLFLIISIKQHPEIKRRETRKHILKNKALALAKKGPNPQCAMRLSRRKFDDMPAFLSERATVFEN